MIDLRSLCYVYTHTESASVHEALHPHDLSLLLSEDERALSTPRTQTSPSPSSHTGAVRTVHVAQGRGEDIYALLRCVFYDGMPQICVIVEMSVCSRPELSTCSRNKNIYIYLPLLVHLCFIDQKVLSV